jgi:hypothetical protein
MMGHYSYRNAAAIGVDRTGNYGGGAKAKLPVSRTSPYVTTRQGCPMFRTQKLLGNRAIASDTFNKPGDAISATIHNPGKGEYVHRDGYNVLYGDWSARWYGDPEKRISYFTWNITSDDWSAYNRELGLRSAALVERNIYLQVAYPPADQPTWTSNKPNSLATAAQDVWHLLDVAGGMDLSAVVCPSGNEGAWQ